MKVKHLTVKRYISDRNDTSTPLHKLLHLITNWYTLDERFSVTHKKYKPVYH